jgi:hypothetical protein
VILTVILTVLGDNLPQACVLSRPTELACEDAVQVARDDDTVNVPELAKLLDRVETERRAPYAAEGVCSCIHAFHAFHRRHARPPPAV